MPFETIGKWFNFKHPNPFELWVLSGVGNSKLEMFSSAEVNPTEWVFYRIGSLPMEYSMQPPSKNTTPEAALRPSFLPQILKTALGQNGRDDTQIIH